MVQMGIKQQLQVRYADETDRTMFDTGMQRRFNYISILALSMTILSSWEAIAGYSQAHAVAERVLLTI